MNKGVLGIWGKFYKIAFIIATVICLLNIGIAGVDYYNLTQKINANHHNVESECLFDGVDKSLDCNSVSSSVESTIAFNDKNSILIDKLAVKKEFEFALIILFVVLIVLSLLKVLARWIFTGSFKR